MDELSLFGFDTARLQLVCQQLYRKAAETMPPDTAGTNSIELTEHHFDLLRQGGGALDAVFRSFLRDAVQRVECRTGERTLCQLALSALLTSERTKNAMTAEESGPRRRGREVSVAGQARGRAGGVGDTQRVGNLIGQVRLAGPSR